MTFHARSANTTAHFSSNVDVSRYLTLVTGAPPIAGVSSASCSFGAFRNLSNLMSRSYGHHFAHERAYFPSASYAEQADHWNQASQLDGAITDLVMIQNQGRIVTSFDEPVRPRITGGCIVSATIDYLRPRSWAKLGRNYCSLANSFITKSF